MGTGIGSRGIDLADDRALHSANGRFDGRDGAGARPTALHYAPLDHEGIRQRTASIASWIAERRPALIVVDVSVEVAMLARLASVPMIYVRLNGQRTDAAHLDAFRGAEAILAPHPRALDGAGVPSWVQEKTCFFGGITTQPSRRAPVDKRILVVSGRGGEPCDGRLYAEAARACPQWQWRVIGPASLPRALPSNLQFAQWVDMPEREIAEASLVVGAAGNGLVGMVMAANRPFVCIPERRPYGEQEATALRLGEIGAAIVCPVVPRPNEWAAVIAAAFAMSDAPRRALHDDEGTAKAAEWIAGQASQAVAAGTTP
ncbi:glycosyltransferase [Sphingobium sp.]|uniref:glycosyltransferase n=1 Tax=Sphingobium sp. TaxID=1912891 RepID=UPI002BD37305|nr:glycosyltransferase [Sphingobium sp.]HUD95805.1 glycosyltransferase [Sphingobium sp.]